MPIQIVVSGLGAIGGYYGAMLAHFAEALTFTRVHFFMRKGAHMETVRNFGLRVVSPKLDFFAKPATIATSADQLPKADILILATKEYDLRKNLKDLAPIITEKTMVMTLQNGLTAPCIVQEMLPQCLVIPGACHITCRRTPGLITVRSDENLLKFGTDPSLSHPITPKFKERIEEFFVLLRAAGVRCSLYEDMGPKLKEKFIMLSPSAAATAYYNLPIGEVIARHETELRELIAELALLYQAMGNRNDLFVEEEAFTAIDRMPKQATTSMHSDIQDGHSSELETLVGYVVKNAKKIKLNVPRYTTFYEAIKERIAKKK